ncbi:hypothetical protein TERTU_1285 [Teredinibacter turnerae T7901]|uniref:Uncharacterized protein n=1 Tax=Teredinibacter turnerae (strain ATCC 39867 / T7901) TaxID=377629 RepID=C5BRW8_TERTT|nr:hypothetical protein TERTU_1285 [Teredinibacter turnerae T7901]
MPAGGGILAGAIVIGAVLAGAIMNIGRRAAERLRSSLQGLA